MKLPGTVPPKVQKVYFTPAAISRSTSRTSSLTMTLAGTWRPVGGGTRGGLVSTAFTGSPCGGPKSPEREPPVSAATEAGLSEAGGCPQAASIEAAKTATNHLFIFGSPVDPRRPMLPPVVGTYPDPGQWPCRYAVSRMGSCGPKGVRASFPSLEDAPGGMCTRDAGDE